MIDMADSENTCWAWSRSLPISISKARAPVNACNSLRGRCCAASTYANVSSAQSVSLGAPDVRAAGVLVRPGAASCTHTASKPGAVKGVVAHCLGMRVHGQPLFSALAHLSGLALRVLLAHPCKGMYRGWYQGMHVSGQSYHLQCGRTDDQLWMHCFIPPFRGMLTGLLGLRRTCHSGRSRCWVTSAATGLQCRSAMVRATSALMHTFM